MKETSPTTIFLSCRSILQLHSSGTSADISICDCPRVALIGQSFFFFLLEYNCFTMLCQFLLYSEVNQLQVYICSHISSLLHLLNVTFINHEQTSYSQLSHMTIFSTCCVFDSEPHHSILPWVLIPSHLSRLTSVSWFPLFPQASPDYLKL